LAGLLAAAAAGLAGSVALDRLAGRPEPNGKLLRVLTRLIHSAAELARSPGRLLLCLAISMAVQCLFVGINIAFAEAAHVEAPVAAWFFAWTSAKIIAIAPISLGGLGVREASMAALLAPELDQQIRFAVDHLRHLVEARRGIHVAGDFHDPLDAIEVAERRLDGGEVVQRAAPRHLVSLFQRHVATHLAGVGERFGVQPADVAADEEQVVDARQRRRPSSPALG